MMRKVVGTLVILMVVGLGWWLVDYSNREQAVRVQEDVVEVAQDVVETVEEEAGGLLMAQHPLSIEYMRDQEYPGSEMIVEQTLSPGSNYDRYVVSYRSEGLKQYAMLTIPKGERPETGWPGIVFNHGYIDPDVYRTTERYVAYVDGFARNGYMVLKPDYRGHGNSEGTAGGGYGSSDYVIDVLHAYSSLEQHPEVDVDRIGMWGHSMGGHITLRAMVIEPNIQAGVIWAGVVGSYEDLMSVWRPYWSRENLPTPTPDLARPGRGRWRRELMELYGTPLDNPVFWDSISATTYLRDAGPIQLHHGTADSSVTVELSENLHERMQAEGLVSELYVYPGDDHNITNNFGAAMRESVRFFDEYVKGETAGS